MASHMREFTQVIKYYRDTKVKKTDRRCKPEPAEAVHRSQTAD